MAKYCATTLLLQTCDMRFGAMCMDGNIDLYAKKRCRQTKTAAWDGEYNFLRTYILKLSASMETCSKLALNIYFQPETDCLTKIGN